LPALSQIAAAGALPEEYCIVGITRQPNLARTELLARATAAPDIADHLELFDMDLAAAADYERLATVENWINNLEREFSQADYVLGLFGLGADGHTAGILPHSPAVSARELVSTYDADKFQRVTITPAAIIKLNEAIVWAQGVDKWPALAQLDQLVSLAEEPAQILKKLERLTIFTDYQVVK
jgi:6-phosphogluconolactonase/glucosamine-6-phosphate isomerase/deaminase